MIGALALRFGPYIACAVLAFALLQSCKEQGKIAAERDQAIALSNLNAKTAEAERQNRVRAEGIATQLSADIETLRKRYSVKRSEVARAPASQDGPIAPVLRGVLNGLHKRPAPIGKDAGDPRHTGAHVPLPGRPIRPGA